MKKTLLLTGFIVAAIVIAANVVVSLLGFGQIDLTENKLYSLSDGTKTILKGLERPVTLKFYYSAGHKDVPPQVKEYGLRLQNLLKSYDKIGGDKVELEIFNPKPFSEEEEWAQKYGVQGARSSHFAVDEDPYFCGLVAISGDREETIPFFQAPQPGQPETVEYDISKIVSEVGRNQSETIGLMSSLPIFGGAPPAANPFQQPPPQQRPKWYFVTELEKFFEIEQVETTVEEIPTNIHTLVVVHPKTLEDGTLYALDQFVMRGGHLLAFVDPLNLADENPQNPQIPAYLMGGSDLNQLTQSWGVELRDGVVADPGTFSTMIQHPCALEIGRDRFGDSIPSLRDLRSVTHILGGGFEVKEKEGVEVTTLFTTSEDAGVVDRFKASPQGDRNDILKDLEAAGEIPLALRITGTLKSAYPEGAPGADTNAAPGLAETTEGVVVLVGDADILSDQFAVRPGRNVFGQPVLMPTGLLNFPIGLIEETSGDTALMGLRNRSQVNRPFTVVDEMEREASKKVQETWEALEKEVAEAQKELDEMKPPEGQNANLFMDAEQRKKQAEVNLKLRKTQKKLKEVAKERIRDVESLGNKIKLGNIAVIPGLIALFGFLRWIVRRSRARPKR